MAKEKRRIYALINPISGIGSKDKIPELLLHYCSEKGYNLEIDYTEYHGHASELTAKAVADDMDCVIAVGGDGTVNEVARQLLYSDVVLGIVPRGSGNGLARELRIPMDVRSAVDVIFSGHETEIDACQANENVFFCTCGFGFDAAISAEFARGKHRGSLSYLKAAVESYLSYKPETYELHIGEQQIKNQAFLITCANASQYGNNAYIAPHADIRDGLMDITILSPFTPIDIGPLAIQLFTKTIDRSSKIKTFRAKSAQIIRPTEGIMHLDGEPVMEARNITLSMHEQSLKVMVPDTLSFVEDVQRRMNAVFQFFEDIISL